MPAVFEGQEVLWFRHGEKGQGAIRCFVMHVWPNGLRLEAVGGRVITTSAECVRHVDDPYFIKKPNAKREDGAWDFAPIWYAERERTEAIMSRLAAVEQQMATLLEQFKNQPGKITDSPFGPDDEIHVGDLTPVETATIESLKPKRTVKVK